MSPRLPTAFTIVAEVRGCVAGGSTTTSSSTGGWPSVSVTVSRPSRTETATSTEVRFTVAEDASLFSFDPLVRQMCARATRPQTTRASMHIAAEGQSYQTIT